MMSRTMGMNILYLGFLMVKDSRYIDQQTSPNWSYTHTFVKPSTNRSPVRYVKTKSGTSTIRYSRFRVGSLSSPLFVFLHFQHLSHLRVASVFWLSSCTSMASCVSNTEITEERFVTQNSYVASSSCVFPWKEIKAIAARLGWRQRR